MHFFIFEDLRVIFHRLLTSMQSHSVLRNYRVFRPFFRIRCGVFAGVFPLGMQIASGVFANAKIQCEESISSRTPQNRTYRAWGGQN